MTLIKYSLLRNVYNFINKNPLLINEKLSIIRKYGSIVIETKTILTMKQVEEKLEKIMGMKEVYSVTKANRNYLMEYLPRSVDELEPRTMQDSFTVVYIPLSLNVELQDEYVSFLKTVRLGKLLEDMDYFAAWVVIQHIKNPLQKPNHPSPYVLLTTLVDKIDFTGVVPKVDKDIKLSGHVSWVSKSSLEVVVWLEQVQNNKWEKITRALIVVAARNPLLTGPAYVNPIQPATAREKHILSGGKERKERRYKIRQKSLKVIIPTEEEQMIIHNLFLSTMLVNDISLINMRLPPNSEWMEKCTLTNIAIAHPENRYFHNLINGGFILKNAFELAFTLAYMFSKRMPKLKSISDVVYHKQIEISSMIRINAHIVYTYEKFIQITVFAESLYKAADKLKSVDKLKTAGEFHFTFQVRKPVKSVIPKTYHEAMLYINGKRHLDAIMNDDQNPNTPKHYSQFIKYYNETFEQK